MVSEQLFECRACGARITESDTCPNCEADPSRPNESKGAKRPYLENISGKGHAAIPEPWPINHENAQFLEVVRKSTNQENWDNTFRAIAIEWLLSTDEDSQFNIAASLDRSSLIYSAMVKHFEIAAESSESMGEEYRRILADLQVINDGGIE